MNSKKHHRRSIRLQHYDYRQAGLYFVTLCCKDRIPYFGTIRDQTMHLNAIGKVAQQCWLTIPNHFNNVVLHQFVIMPNHIHGIIEIIDNVVGANHYLPLKNNEAENRKGAKDVSPLQGTSNTLGSIIRGFKIGVTKWVRKNTPIHQIWQRNYYEHIIRNEKSYLEIAEYIENNPFNWQKDCLYCITNELIS